MKAKLIFLVPTIILMAVVLAYLLIPRTRPKIPINQTHYNFCILLDLSNRIDPAKHPDQIYRDISIIKEVASTFEDQVKRKLYIGSKDRIQIAIAPQPVGYNSVILKVGDNLGVDMKTLKVAEKRNKLPDLKQAMLTNVTKLYEEAAKNSNFIGADIWGFFKNTLDGYLTSDSNTKNIVIILTDGYLEFDKSVLRSRSVINNQKSYMEVGWFLRNPPEFARFDSKNYGLIPVGFKDEFKKNTEVLVLEINPRDILNTRESDIIHKYWAKWFEQMEFKGYKLLNRQDTIHQTMRVFREFVLPGSSNQISSTENKPSTSSIETPEPSLPPDPTSTPNVSQIQPAIKFADVSAQFFYKENDQTETPVSEGSLAIFWRLAINPQTGKEIKAFKVTESKLDGQGVATFKSVPCSTPFKITFAPGSLGYQPKSIVRPNEYANKSDPLKCESNRLFIGKYVLNVATKSQIAKSPKPTPIQADSQKPNQVATTPTATPTPIEQPRPRQVRPRPPIEETPSPTPLPKTVNVSGGVLQGNAIRKVQPSYPTMARSMRIEGNVEIRVVISEEGKVLSASVISGPQLLREAALQAAKQWLFKPTQLSGIPIKTEGVLTFNFKIQ